MTQKIWFSSILALVLLSASFYMLVPDKAKIVFENTRTRFYIEDDGWKLGATEYLYVFDGVTKMRAKNRSINYSVDGTVVTWTRIANYKDNITTIQKVYFDTEETDIKNIPVSSTATCINCKGKIVHFEYRDLIYSGVTRAAISPESFGRKMNIEWQNGYDWAKVYQQTTTSDKLVIRYRPVTSEETYKVRMFDPPSETNLTIHSYDADTNIEHGSSVNLSATVSPNTLTVCISSSHPDLGDNFSCGVGSTEYNWTATGGVTEFSDGSTSKLFSFNGSGNQNAELQEVRNGSSFDRTIVTITGTNISGIKRQNILFKVESDSTSSSYGVEGNPILFNKLNESHPSEFTWDGDRTTYFKGAEIPIYQVYAFGNAYVNSSTTYVTWKRFYQVKYPNASTTYASAHCWNWSSSLWTGTFFVEEGIGTDQFVLRNDTTNVSTSCINSTTGEIVFYMAAYVNGASEYWPVGGYIEYDDYSYPNNVEVDVDEDGVADWGMIGELQGNTAYISNFYEDLYVSMNIFSEPGTSVSYIKIPKEYNISSLTMRVTPYETLNPISEGGKIATEEIFTSASGDLKEGTDLIYFFGGTVINDDGEGNIESLSDLNRTQMWSIGTDNITRLDDAPYDVGLGSCSNYWNDTSKYGQKGFFIFGGSNATDILNSAYFRGDNGTWTQLTNYPVTEHWFNCVEHGDGFYLFGGLVGSTGKNTSYFYNVSSDAWTALTDSPYVHYASDSIVMPNEEEILIAGGQTRRMFYNITSDSWSYETAYACTVLGSSYFKLNNKYYCASGGSYGEGYHDTIKKMGMVGISEYDDFYEMNQDQYTTGMYNAICVDYLNYEACLWGSADFSFDYQELYFNPKDVTLKLGDQTSPNWQHNDTMLVAETTSNLATAFNEELSSCTPDAEGYCIIPLYLTNTKSGNIKLDILTLEYTVATADLDLGIITCENNYCNASLNITSTSTGGVNISNLNITYLGTANVNITADTLGGGGYDSSNESHLANIYYTSWDYSFPTGINYLEFIPRRPTSDEVEAFGQTNGRPILNISFGTLDKNASWYALVNESHSCVNLTYSATWNYSAGVDMSDGLWHEFMDNKETGESTPLYMWADFECNYSTWQVWQPDMFFKSCCENCVCDNSTS